jgi:hypothetical protein
MAIVSFDGVLLTSLLSLSLSLSYLPPSPSLSPLKLVTLENAKKYDLYIYEIVYTPVITAMQKVTKVFVYIEVLLSKLNTHCHRVCLIKIKASN